MSPKLKEKKNDKKAQIEWQKSWAIKSNKALSEEREKEKIQPKIIKKHRPKKIKMKAPKMKWAKFKRLTQIEDLVKHERHPKKILDEV